MKRKNVLIALAAVGVLLMCICVFVKGTLQESDVWKKTGEHSLVENETLEDGKPEEQRESPEPEHSGESSLSETATEDDAFADAETKPEIFSGEPGSPESETVKESEPENPEEQESPAELETIVETEKPTEPETLAESETPVEPEVPTESEPSAEPEKPTESETPAEPEKPSQTVHVHAYSVTAEMAATCQAEGSRTYGCTCGDSYVETLPKTGHNNVTDSRAATCSAAGYSKTYCTFCELVSQESSSPATGEHTFAGVVTSQASCSQEGVMTYTCSGCGTSKTEPIPTEDHYMLELERKEYCDAEGTVTYICAYCGITTTGSCPALGGTHDLYESWIIAPSCTHPGATGNEKCRKCDRHVVLTPHLLEHQPDEGTVTRPGDCVNPAEITIRCVRCNTIMEYTTGDKDPNNHSWDIDIDSGIEYCGSCGVRK